MKQTFWLVMLLVILPKLGNAEAIEYECKFEMVCVDVEYCQAIEFNFKFLLDTITKDAYMVGNLGLSPVRVHNGYEALTFIESLPTGAVQTTTILNTGEAIHSRNTVILGAPAPSQYSGKCTRLES